MKKSQIFTRTFICAMSIMTVLLILLHFLVYVLFPHFYLENTKTELTEKADLLSKTLEGLDEASVKNYLAIYAKNDNISITARPNNAKSNLNSDTVDIKNDLKIDKTNTDNSVFIEIRSIKLADGKEVLLEFISSRNAKKDAENLTLNFLPYSLGIGLMFSILFAYLSSKIIVKPILEAEKIASDVERAKNDFLRSASHELKTPLAGLRITLENMKYEIGDYKNHQKYLTKSLNTVDKISTTLNEILKNSSYQGWLKEPVEIQLRTNLEKIIKDYQPLISEKALKIRVNILDDKIKLSESAFSKLFSNLISNAIKYANENGNVKIFTEKDWLYIENECVPIKKQEISEMFNIFKHGEHPESTGIGLFVVKNILEHYKFKYRFAPTKTGMQFKIKLKNSVSIIKESE